MAAIWVVTFEGKPIAAFQTKKAADAFVIQRGRSQGVSIYDFDVYDVEFEFS